MNPKFYTYKKDLLIVFNALLIICFTVCCSDKNNRPTRTHKLRIIETKGHAVPMDSMAKPKVVLVDESKLKKIPAGKPKVIPANLNVHLAGAPKIIHAGRPRICTPGLDSFSLPKTVPAIGKTILAGSPEEVIAYDAVSKDHNPANFSSFGRLQGLRSGLIRCMLEDNHGNLWFGKDGDGLSRYDGKSFAHFNEKQGLADNSVGCLLQDKKGNIWIGTFEAGLCRYDGKYFISYSEKEGLADNMIRSLL